MILNFHNPEQNDFLYGTGNHQANLSNVTKAYESNAKFADNKIVKASDVAVSLHSGNGNVSGYEGQGKTKEDIMAEMGLEDVTVMRNYMTVMSNTMSGEDYKKLTEEGVNPTKTDVGATVNTLDKIKARLAEAGVIIEGYNDDLSKEELQEITGSPVVANEIENAFHERNIPLTEENVTKATEAIKQAMEIEQVTDGMCDYILRNGIDPTLDHLYRVRFSAAEVPGRNSGFYGEDVPGYMTRQATEPVNIDQMMGRIEETIREAGLPVDDQTVAESKWIIENGIIYNSQNVASLHALWGIYAPLEMSDVASAVANAIELGKEPKNAYLNDTVKLYDKAKAFTENITSRRELEEVRLKLTVESSYRLMRQGVNVDITAIEELVNTLKALEDETNQKLFGTGEESPEVIDERALLYKETRQQIVKLPFMPLGAVGEAIKEYGEVTVGGVYKAGIAMQKMYETALETYESYGTEVRTDLGDSVKKAFANAGGMLNEMGLENNDTNNRAVRILTYASMEINPENIEKVTKEDASLSRVIDKMTPETTLNLIREGVNPLEVSIEELEAKIDEMANEPEAKASEYAKFLLKLDRKGDITEAERESYIGIYRMLHQIDASDGGALGRLVNTGAEINFKNLLTAVRTGKTHGMDIKLDESLGALAENAGYTNDISEQIWKGFTEAIKEDTAADIEYTKEMVEEMRQALDNPDNVLKELKYYGEAITPENMASMANILSGDEEIHPYKVFKDIEKKLEKEDSPLDKALSEYVDSFDDEDSTKEALEKVIKEAGNTLTDIMYETDRVDVKAMNSAFKQLTMMGRLSREENYEVPIEMDGGVRSLKVKILHEEGKEGNVVASITTEKYGPVSAQFYVRDGKVEGIIAGSDKEGLNTLQENETFKNSLSEGGVEVENLRYIHSENLNTNLFYSRHAENRDMVDTKDLYKIAKTFIKAMERAGE